MARRPQHLGRDRPDWTASRRSAGAGGGRAWAMASVRNRMSSPVLYRRPAAPRRKNPGAAAFGAPRASRRALTCCERSIYQRRVLERREPGHELHDSAEPARPPEPLPALRPRLAARALRQDGRLGRRCRSTSTSRTVSPPPTSRRPAPTSSARSTTIDWGRKTLSVRINGLDTEFWYRDVVDMLEQAGERLDLLMIPKAGNAARHLRRRRARQRRRGRTRARQAHRLRGDHRDRARASLTSARSPPPRRGCRR